MDELLKEIAQSLNNFEHDLHLAIDERVFELQRKDPTRQIIDTTDIVQSKQTEYAKQILIAFQSYYAGLVGDELLTPEELEAIADKIEKAVGVPPNPIRYITIAEVANAQAAKSKAIAFARAPELKVLQISNMYAEHKLRFNRRDSMTYALGYREGCKVQLEADRKAIQVAKEGNK